MKLHDHFASIGNVFFRWRGYLPLMLLPLFIVSLLEARYPFNSHILDQAWESGCFLLSLLGVAIRILTAGTVPQGTSGRNTHHQKAAALNTTGMYSVVRHPLYVGNYLIALGLSCFPRVWYLPIIVSLASLLFYERIAFREEQYLEEKFGEEFRAWAAQVPAMIPTLRHYRPPALPFSWGRALGREFYTLSILTTSFFLMDAIQEFVITGRIAPDPVWTPMFLFGAVFFAVMRVLKKQTGLLKRLGA